MRSKHLSVRKCIDKKPDKIKEVQAQALLHAHFLIVTCQPYKKPL